MVIAGLFALALTSSAIAQTTDPVTGPYIGCGKLTASIGKPVVFDVATANYRHRVELTNINRVGQKDGMGILLLIALGNRTMERVCIRGFIYRNSQNQPVLLPESANLQYKQLR